MIVKIFSSSVSSIYLDIEDEIWKRMIKMNIWENYIPSFSFKRAKHGKNKLRIDLKILKKNKFRFKLEKDKVIYSNSFKIKEDFWDIATLSEYLLEKNRQKRGIYCLHSSTAIVNQKAIIFFGGATGMGKTTFAKEIFKSLNGSLFFDEKTLIDFTSQKVIGGILTDWNPQNIKSLKIPEKSYPIAFFIYPHIERQGRPVIKKWNPQIFDWHLYEEVSRKIRGTSRRINNLSYPLLSLDTFQLSQKRVKLVETLTKNIDCFYLKGPVTEITKIIAKIYPKYEARSRSDF